MAEINSDSGSSFALKQFWSAASLLTLTTSVRLIRNIRHYNSDTSQHADSEQIKRTLGYLQSVMHSYHGILTQYQSESTSTDQDQNWLPALIALREHVYQQWYYLHQQLLFFPANQIEKLIPLVDFQLKAWKSAPEEDQLIVDGQQFIRLNHLRSEIANQWQLSDS